MGKVLEPVENLEIVTFFEFVVLVKILTADVMGQVGSHELNPRVMQPKLTHYHGGRLPPVRIQCSRQLGDFAAVER